MTLKTFAAKHRLKIKLDSCGDAIVQGKFGTIYEYSDELLGLTFMPSTSHGRRWAAAQREMLVAGMVITQNGDAEGAATFSGEDSKQAKLAIKVIKCRKRRELTPEQIAAVTARLTAGRQPRA